MSDIEPGRPYVSGMAAISSEGVLGLGQQLNGLLRPAMADMNH